MSISIKKKNGSKTKTRKRILKSRKYILRGGQGHGQPKAAKTMVGHFQNKITRVSTYVQKKRQEGPVIGASKLAQGLGKTLEGFASRIQAATTPEKVQVKSNAVIAFGKEVKALPQTLESEEGKALVKQKVGDTLQQVLQPVKNSTSSLLTRLQKFSSKEVISKEEIESAKKEIMNLVSKKPKGLTEAELAAAAREGIYVDLLPIPRSVQNKTPTKGPTTLFNKFSGLFSKKAREPTEAELAQLEDKKSAYMTIE